jgi:hypothetical protein
MGPAPHFVQSQRAERELNRALWGAALRLIAMVVGVGLVVVSQVSQVRGWPLLLLIGTILWTAPVFVRGLAREAQADVLSEPPLVVPGLNQASTNHYYRAARAAYLLDEEFGAAWRFEDALDHFAFRRGPLDGLGVPCPGEYELRGGSFVRTDGELPGALDAQGRPIIQLPPGKYTAARADRLRRQFREQYAGLRAHKLTVLEYNANLYQMGPAMRNEPRAERGPVPIEPDPGEDVRV